MANKYIRHGETYDGDGTSSAAATSNGGVGAWNNINIFEGTTPTYGSLSAGDTVFIRSQDNTDTDITVTAAADITIGLAGLSASSDPVEWVIDDGTIWSGINGTVTYQTTGAYEFYVSDTNNITSGYKKLKFYLSTAWGDSYLTLFTINGYSRISGAFFDFGLSTQTRGARFKFGNNNYKHGVCHNCAFKVGGRNDWLIGTASGVVALLSGCDIELIDASATHGIFYTGAYGAKVEMIGGRIHGAGVTSSVPLIATNTSGQHRFIGVDIPKTLAMPSSFSPGYQAMDLIILAGDKEAGSVYYNHSALLSSRDDGNFPTLNATLDDSTSTSWSWYLHPYDSARYKPAQVITTAIYSGTAAAKTITLEALIEEGFTELNQENTYITVSYVDDATGNMVTETTRDPAGGALTSSTASWSATTYGANTFDKRKFSLTTANSIRQDTVVTICLHVGQKSVDSTDLIFIDPAVSVT